MNGLDKEGIADVQKLFLDLKEHRRTILLASHNTQDIDVLYDRVFEIEHGVLEEVK